MDEWSDGLMEWWMIQEGDSYESALCKAKRSFAEKTCKIPLL